jgi:hypothetical protein
MGMPDNEIFDHTKINTECIELYEKELDNYYRLLIEFSLAVENAANSGKETKGYFYNWIKSHIEGEIVSVRTRLTMISELKTIYIQLASRDLKDEIKFRDFLNVVTLISGYRKEIKTSYDLFREHFDGFSRSLNQSPNSIPVTGVKINELLTPLSEQEINQEATFVENNRFFVDHLTFLNGDWKFVVSEACDPMYAHVEIYHDNFYEESYFNVSKETFLHICNDTPGLFHSDNDLILFYIRGPSRPSYYSYLRIKRGDDKKVIRTGHDGSDRNLSDIWNFFFTYKNTSELAKKKDNWILLKFKGSQIALTRENSYWEVVGVVYYDKDPTFVCYRCITIQEFLSKFKEILLNTKPRVLAFNTAKNRMDIYLFNTGQFEGRIASLFSLLEKTCLEIESSNKV